MAVVAYKCPNCGAPLEFSPESQKFECSFCGSSFSEEELQKYEPAQSSEQTIAACTVTGRWCWRAACRESSIPTV